MSLSRSDVRLPLSPEPGSNDTPGEAIRLQRCQRCLNHGIIQSRRNHVCRYKTPTHTEVCFECKLIDSRREYNRKISQKNDVEIDIDVMGEVQEFKDSRKRTPICATCRMHGMTSLLKNHKNVCPYRDCTCDKCVLIKGRRRIMSIQVKLRRMQQHTLVADPEVGVTQRASRKSSDCSSLAGFAQQQQQSSDDDERTMQPPNPVLKPVAVKPVSLNPVVPTFHQSLPLLATPPSSPDSEPSLPSVPSSIRGCGDKVSLAVQTTSDHVSDNEPPPKVIIIERYIIADRNTLPEILKQQALLSPPGSATTFATSANEIVRIVNATSMLSSGLAVDDQQQQFGVRFPAASTTTTTTGHSMPHSLDQIVATLQAKQSAAAFAAASV